MSDSQTPSTEDLARVRVAWQAHRRRFTYTEIEDGILVRDGTRAAGPEGPIDAWLLKSHADGSLSGYSVAMVAGPSAAKYPEELARDILAKPAVLVVKSLSMDETLRVFGLLPDAQSLPQQSVTRFLASLGNDLLAARLPRGDFLEAEVKRLDKAGVATYRAGLNMEALDALKAVEGMTWRDYKFYCAPDQQGLYRRQAAAQYPLMATVMARSIMLARAIDQTQPLADAIERRFTPPADNGAEAPKPLVTKAALARLRGITMRTHDLPPESIAQAMSSLPVDWFPKKAGDWKEEDWTAFCDLTATVGTWMRMSLGTNLDTLYEGCKGKWAELRDRVVRSFTDTRPPAGTDEQSAAALHGLVDWKQLAKIPRDQVHAAIQVATDRLEPHIPAGVAKADVQEWITRLTAPDTSRQALQGAINEMNEVIHAFAQKIILPVAANETGLDDVRVAHRHWEAAEKAAATVIFGGKSAVQCFEIVRKFAGQAARIMAAGADEEDMEAGREAEAAEEQRHREAVGLLSVGVNPDAPIPEDGWPAMTPAVQAPNGLWIVPMTSPAMLADEGRGWDGGGGDDVRRNDDGSLGNCLCIGQPWAGHVRSCQERGFQAFSIRIPGQNGEPYVRLSTCKVEPNYEKLTMKVAEHRGLRNGPVPEEAQRAWTWFEEEVKAGNIPVNAEQIKAIMAKAEDKTDPMGKVCGYRWQERKRIELAMRPWGGLVGKKYRSMNLDTFGAQPEITAVCDLIDPAWRRLRQEAAEAGYGRALAMG